MQTKLLLVLALAATAATAAQAATEADLAVPGGTVLFTLNGVGAQNYTCDPASNDPDGGKLTWTQVGPLENFSDDKGNKIVYYISPQGKTRTYVQLGPNGEAIGSFQGDNKAPVRVKQANSDKDLDLTKYTAINQSGSLKGVTYVVRTAASGGQPPKSCAKVGDKLVVPYTSTIVIYGSAPTGAAGRKLLAAAASA